MEGGKPLATFFRILILLVLFLTLGFYVNINEKNNKEELIKEDTTLPTKKLLSVPDSGRQAFSHPEKPKEGLAQLIGMDLNHFIELMGKPQRIDRALYGYDWYIYKDDYNHYFQAGIENNKVVTLYAIGKDLNVSPFEITEPVEEIFNTQFINASMNIDINGNLYRLELNDSDLNSRPLLQIGDVYAQLYIDRFTGTLSSVRFLNAETLIKERPYEIVYRGQLLEPEQLDRSQWKLIEKSTEQEIFDLTNVLRTRHNLKPLKWDEKTAIVAYGHSKDMAIHHDFSHTSKKYGSLSDRLKTAKVIYQSAGENIAANYTDGPAVVEGWLNSKGHRDSLLNKEYTHLGVGVYKKYYTQNFIRKWAQ